MPHNAAGPGYQERAILLQFGCDSIILAGNSRARRTGRLPVFSAADAPAARREDQMRGIRTASALMAAFVLAPVALAAQEPFQGTVAYSMQMNDMNIDMVHHVKGGKVRQEMSGVPGMGDMIVLLDMNTMQMNMLMPAQKAYMSMDLNAMANAQLGQNEMETPDVTRTGEMETVAGHQCENVRIVMKEGTVNMCVASDLGYYFMGGGAGGGRNVASPAAGMSEEMQEKIREMFSDGFFPLRMTMSQNGQNIRMTATSIQKKSVSDDLFVIPAGYTKMPGMGGGN
jgi:hypothetical protein